MKRAERMLSMGILLIGCLFLGSGLTGCGSYNSDTTTTSFSLSSSDLPAGQEIGSAFLFTDCNGTNQSPALSWSYAPSGLKSLAVTVIDQSNSDFVHWVIYNIPSSVTELSRGATAPSGATFGPNDINRQSAYAGPCPPVNVLHVYEFKVWALDTEDLTTSSGIDVTSPSSLVAAIKAHATESANFTRNFTGPP